MGNVESFVDGCSNCDNKVTERYKCEKCKMEWCKYCLNDWKMYHVKICKKCRPKRDKKMPKAKCTKCENYDTTLYQCSCGKLFCKQCEFQAFCDTNLSYQCCCGNINEIQNFDQQTL